MHGEPGSAQLPQDPHMLVIAALVYLVIVGIVMFSLAMAASDGTVLRPTDPWGIDEIERYANHAQSGDAPDQSRWGAQGKVNPANQRRG